MMQREAFFVSKKKRVKRMLAPCQAYDFFQVCVKKQLPEVKVEKVLVPIKNYFSYSRHSEAVYEDWKKMDLICTVLKTLHCF